MDEATAQTQWREAIDYLGEGQLKDAERLLRGLIEGGATGPEPRYMLAFALLAQGRYEEGFKYYQARSEIRQFGLNLPLLPFPRWRGEPLTGKRILVWREQGFGDEIMFSRFALLLADRGAQVTLAVRPMLARLLEGTPVAILPIGGSFTFSGFDFVASLCDLPHLTGATLEHLPSPWPIRRRLRRTTGDIGIVTRGAPQHANDRHRSLPLELANELLGLPRAKSLHPEDTGVRCFHETAELISGLDLVISVDTAIAHLAASMGTPTWILLPHHRTDWRWMRERADTPWYPSARLYRQTPAGRWDDVIAALRADLAWR